MPFLSPTETCPSCGAATAPSTSGATHRYLESSPGCWAAYGEVLAREYADPAYFAVHALTVDAYSVQHPGRPGPQTIASIHLHLASLYAHLKRGSPVAELAAVKQRVAAFKAEFEWIDPPEHFGGLTVADVLKASSASEHVEAVTEWATTAFMAWSEAHTRMEAWLRRL